MKKIRIGTGAGCGNDRIEPAIDIVKKGNLDYIVFECLSERTISIAQLEKLKDPNKGYNELFEYRLKKILKLCKEKETKIITNMGAANPEAAGEKAVEIAKKLGLNGLKIAVVLGDDILDKLDKYKKYPTIETGTLVEDIDGEFVSANVYLGIEGIVEALGSGADIIITGRVADPSLYLAPLVYEFGWENTDEELFARGTLLGHMLECGAQVSGGYFSEPGFKEVKDPWNPGFPIAEVDCEGDFKIFKVDGSGGAINHMTCSEQLLYEIHDPSEYITPDCIADFSNVSIEEISEDIVSLKGAKGKGYPEKLKVSIGYTEYYLGEGQISYGGSGALDRAKLAADIIKKRLDYTGVKYEELRFDFIGHNSLYGDTGAGNKCEDLRLRVVGRTKSKEDAFFIGNEVETMYTNGPAAGGGASKKVNQLVSIASILIPREDVDIRVIYKEV